MTQHEYRAEARRLSRELARALADGWAPADGPVSARATRARLGAPVLAGALLRRLLAARAAELAIPPCRACGLAHIGAGWVLGPGWHDAAPVGAPEPSTCSHWQTCRHAACRAARELAPAPEPCGACDARPRSPIGAPDGLCEPCRAQDGPAHHYGDPCSCAECLAGYPSRAEYLADYTGPVPAYVPELAADFANACTRTQRAADGRTFACARPDGHIGTHYGRTRLGPVRLGFGL